MAISIMSHSPAVSYTPVLLLLCLSQDLLATEAPLMAAMEVMCSVRQHEVAALHSTRGHKDCHMLYIGEGEGIQIKCCYKGYKNW